MKLLTKSEISIAKQRDSFREAQEGLKLTRRVDSLRELRLSEEKKLEDWRRETLETIQKEITILDEERKEKKKELLILETKLAELSPKMATERHSLLELKKELNQWQKDLEKKASGLLSDELEIAEAIKEADIAKEKALKHETKTAELELSAEKKHFNAENTLRRAQTIHETAVKEREDIERSLSLRENAIVLREKKAEAMEMANMKQEKENQNEQKRLEDVSAMLQRDLLRMKKLRTNVSR